MFGHHLKILVCLRKKNIKLYKFSSNSDNRWHYKVIIQNPLERRRSLSKLSALHESIRIGRKYIPRTRNFQCAK